jgi:hypothetical protein
MKPSERCKAAGLKSLAELSEITGESVQTLNNWYKYKPIIFDALLMWALRHKRKTEKMRISARDPFSGELVELTASLTTEHSAADHPQPIMIIEEWRAGMMSHKNWELSACRVISPGNKEQQALFSRWRKRDLQQRIDRLKTTAMMQAREQKGAVELVHWWANFRAGVLRKKSFEELDQETQSQILEWEADPYQIIGT